jgi:serine/threonine protein kinase
MKNPKTFETLGNTYSVQALLGEGGAGRVFKVLDADNGVFALKWMNPERVSTEKIKRFCNELKFCSSTRHHRILRVIDSGFHIVDGRKIPFFVMRHYPKTLRDHINAGMPPSTAAEVFAHLLDGVEAAHLQGIWHRDLKPENILCREEAPELVVADFGIAHFSRDLLETVVETNDASRLANFTYAAPEQRQKGLVVDRRADHYALGLMLHELFTKEVPHGKDHRLIADVAPAFGYLDNIVNWLLQHDPERRPQSIDVLKSELIGHRSAAVAKQKLDELKREVVSTDELPEFVEVRPVGVTYAGRTLTIEFDQAPAPAWVALFRSPPESHSFILGAEPGQFSFRGATASVTVESDQAQAVMNNAKQWTAIANRVHPRMLREQHEAQLREERQALEERIRVADEDARITAQLKL